MKNIITLLILFGLFSCSTNDGELIVDSPEAKNTLKAELKLSESDVAKEIHYWIQHDSSSTAFFKTDSSTIGGIIDRFEMTPDTSYMYVWIPENSPAWFGPSIDKSNKQYKTWIKEYSDYKMFLQANEQFDRCFFAKLKWQ